MKLKYIPFLNKLNKEIEKLGIDLKGAKLDHIAYQTSTPQEYNKLKPMFEEMAKLIKEPLVDKRRVGVFLFNKPLIYKKQEIKVIELIEPKNEQICLSGLEHAEYLLPVTLEKFINLYPNINWNTEAINREHFPMITLKLTKNIRVKFPRFPILS